MVRNLIQNNRHNIEWIVMGSFKRISQCITRLFVVIPYKAIIKAFNKFIKIRLICFFFCLCCFIFCFRCAFSFLFWRLCILALYITKIYLTIFLSSIEKNVVTFWVLRMIMIHSNYESYRIVNKSETLYEVISEIN